MSTGEWKKHDVNTSKAATPYFGAPNHKGIFVTEPSPMAS
jgi:hypothetical protein